MKQINLRVTEEEYEKAKEAAYQRRVSMNALFQKMINELSVEKRPSVIDEKNKKIPNAVLSQPKPKMAVPQKPPYTEDDNSGFLDDSFAIQERVEPKVKVDNEVMSLKEACERCGISKEKVLDNYFNKGVKIPFLAFDGLIHRDAKFIN
jgi:hypothetical protein